jgi:hypothetical protein
MNKFVESFPREPCGGQSLAGCSGSQPVAKPIAGPFHSVLAGTVLVATWVLNDVFNAARQVCVGDREEIVIIAMRIFVGAFEMGTLARKFPRAIFAIGAAAKTRNADIVFNFYATAARIGIVMTGRNVASGVRDHESLDKYKHPDGWRYINSDDSGAATALALGLQRDVECALAISSGGRAFQQNLAETERGEAMFASGALGRGVSVEDARGIGNPAAQISPSRWAGCREAKRSPDKWCVGFATNLAGDANAPMDIPWDKIPGAKCNPANIVLEYNKPAYIDPLPSWLTIQGFRGKMRGSVPLGSSTLMPGSDRPQFVGPGQEAQWLAAQELDFGFKSDSGSQIGRGENHVPYRVGLCGPDPLCGGF